MKTAAAPPLPPEVKATLWSYDTSKLAVQADKRLIIGAVLNYGTKAATDWLFAQYAREEIKQTAAAIPRGAWDKRSLALWSLVLDFTPAAPRQERFT